MVALKCAKTGAFAWKMLPKPLLLTRRERLSAMLVA
jgi:hypothetical protein